MNELHNEDSKSLIMHLGKTKDCEELFMNKLPVSYNLNSVRKWTTNKTDSLTQKIRAGKLHVEQGLYIVNPPAYSFEGKDVMKSGFGDSFKVSYCGTLKLKITPATEHIKIFITSNGLDPKDPNAQREESAHIFEYETKEDKEISFCGMDNERNYSKRITLKLVNEDNKYEAKFVPQQPHFGVNEGNFEPEIKLTLPKDEDSLLKCIKSIVAQSKTRYNLKDRDFEKVLKTLLNEYKG